MTKLKTPQQDLLHAIARGGDSFDMPDPRPAALAGLIKRGFAMVIPNSEGRDRILITEAGRGAAAPAVDYGETEGAALELPATEVAAPRAAPQGLQEGPLEGTGPQGKLGLLVGLLRRPGGATLPDIMVATGWQAHSVRGAIAGAVKKKLGLDVVSAKVEGIRVYRISAPVDAVTA
jgi:hypothetical protein